MRNVALAEVACKTTTPLQVSEAGNQVAAIANIWQFWTDETMAISLIVPPRGADFADFPCGVNAIGQPFVDVIGIERNAEAVVEFHGCFRAQERIINARFVNARGRTVLVNGAPQWNDAGELEGFRCTAADITPSMEGPGVSTDYGAMLDAFIAHAPNLVVIKDLEGRYKAVSQVAERVYGATRLRMIGNAAHDILPKMIADECAKEDHSVLESEALLELEQTFPEQSGARTFHTVKFPIFDSEKSLVGTGAVGVDVTDESGSGAYHRGFLDHLTNLPNRRLMKDRLEQALLLGQRGGWMTGVIMLDIGDFHAMNNAMGRVAADWLLIEVAGTLRELCGPMETLCRFGADTFAILVPAVTSAPTFEAMAGRILETLRKPLTVGDDQVSIQPSVGTALSPRDSLVAIEIIYQADAALARAKKQGRGTVRHTK
jgi:diguanylate cyclase (GGDEF)-like protein